MPLHDAIKATPFAAARKVHEKYGDTIELPLNQVE
jgi:hypothetical protein